MKGKETKWFVVTNDDKVLEYARTREEARDSKKWYLDNIFNEWMQPMQLPLKIVREQWELVDKKVVR